MHEQVNKTHHTGPKALTSLTTPVAAYLSSSCSWACLALPTTTISLGENCDFLSLTVIFSWLEREELGVWWVSMGVWGLSMGVMERWGLL